MVNLLIRPAVTEDYPAVERIISQVQALHVSWRPDIYKTISAALPFEEFCEDVQKGCALVAELEGAVVAALFYECRNISHERMHSRKVLYIDMMAVDEKYRSRGIGHALFDHMKALYLSGGYDGFELQVNARNAAARRFYESYGFTEKSINMELL